MVFQKQTMEQYLIENSPRTINKIQDIRDEISRIGLQNRIRRFVKGPKHRCCSLCCEALGRRLAIFRRGIGELVVGSHRRSIGYKLVICPVCDGKYFKNEKGRPKTDIKKTGVVEGCYYCGDIMTKFSNHYLLVKQKYRVRSERKTRRINRKDPRVRKVTLYFCGEECKHKCKEEIKNGKKEDDRYYFQ